jgi:hypothetical protein
LHPSKTLRKEAQRTKIHKRRKEKNNMKYDVVRRVCISMFSQKTIAVTLIVLVMSVVLISVQAQPPKVVDGGTKFYRVYVTGPGKSVGEESGFRDDRDELKDDLEQAGNQGAGSNSQSMEKPTKQQLRNALDALKNATQPGEEVTLYIGGHGNGGNGGLNSPGEANDAKDEFVWLNDANGNGKADYPDEILTDDELATMLTGFRTSVTTVVIMDSCYGGGFTGGANDIQETDHVAVVGPSATAPIDPPGIWGAFTSTLTEDAADGGGERYADANEDGKVTAEELKNWLGGRGWSLGPPNDSNPGKIKNGKSKIIGLDGAPVILPSITPDTFTPSPGAHVGLNGKNFAGYSMVGIYLVKPDLTLLDIGYVQSDQNGFFIETVMIPSIPIGQYLLFVEDGEANVDWQILSVGDVGGIAIPIDKFGLLAPYIGLASTMMIGAVVTAIFARRAKRRKEKQ